MAGEKIFGSDTPAWGRSGIFPNRRPDDDALVEAVPDEPLPIPASQRSSDFNQQLLDQEFRESFEKIRNSATFAEPRDPEKSAKAFQASRQLGLPFTVAEAQQAMVGPQKDYRRSWGNLARSSPALAEWMADPGFAAAVADDVDNLSFFEKIFSTAGGRTWEATTQQYNKAKLSRELAQISEEWKLDPDAKMPATRERLYRAKMIERELQASEPKLGWIPGMAKHAAGFVEPFEHVGGAVAAGAAYGGAAGAVGGPLAPATVPAGMALGSMAGLTAGLTVDQGAMENSLAYYRTRRAAEAAGSDPMEAKRVADSVSMITGLAVGAINLAPIHKVFNFIPGMGSAVTGEVVQDAMRALIGTNTGRAAVLRASARMAESGAVLGLMASGTELSKELTAVGYKVPGAEISSAGTYAEIFGSGFQGGVAFGALGAGTKFVGDMQNVELANQRQAMWTALAERGKASKTIERLPDQAKGYINHLLTKYKDAPIEAKVPAEALTEVFQKEKISMEKLEKIMPEVARQLRQNTDPKAEVVVPMADIATHLSRLDGFEKMSQDLRVSDELTLREMAKVKDAAAQMKGEKGPQTPETPEGQVWEDVNKQLVDSGQHPKIAGDYATMVAAFAKVMGADTGSDAKTYYDSIGLKIESGEIKTGEGEVARGSTAFGPDREAFTIKLTKDSNLSTFLHESGHAFLELMRRDAHKSEAVASRLKVFHEWLGVDGKAGEQVIGMKENISAVAKLSEEQLEKFARGFEAYLRDGKAPSEGLRGAFRSFAAWLKLVYQNLSQLRVSLTDEVRASMDRMLATDKEIAEAQEAVGLKPDTTGMTPVEAERYTKAFNEALQATKEELEQDSIRKIAEVYRENREAIEAEVMSVIEMDQDHNTIALLRDGTDLRGRQMGVHVAVDLLQPIGSKVGKMAAKLDRAKVKEILGENWSGRMEKMTAENGLDPEALAPYLKYEDGESMIWKLWGKPDKDVQIREMVNRKIAEKYPDADFATITAKAKEYLHNSERIEGMLWHEAEASAAKSTYRTVSRVTKEAIKQAAMDHVADMTYTELQTGMFERAEARWSAEWGKQLKAGDFGKAYEAKLQQIINRMRWKYANEAKVEIEKARGYLDGMKDLRTRRKIAKAGPSYLNAMDALMEGAEFKKRSNTQLVRRASLLAFLEEIEEDSGTELAIPEALRDDAKIKNYKQMTLAEIRAVRDAVKNIEHMALHKNKLFDGIKRRDFEKTATQLAENVKAKAGNAFAEKPGDDQNAGTVEKVKRYFRKSDAEKRKMEFVLRVLDGGDTAGWAHELGFQPFVKSEERSTAMYRDITERLMKPFRKLSTKERLRMDRKVDFLGTKMRMQEVLSVALNMGNAGNRRKLVEGYAYRGWTDEKVLARLGELLTDKDMDLIEHTWKTVGSLWPEIEALTRRELGIPPPAVEALPFTINGRTLGGGYFPVVYDRYKTKNQKAEAIAQRRADLKQNAFSLPSVARSFTETRTNFTDPIKLSLDVIPSHLSEVIHYLTHYEAVRSVDKLFQHKAVKTAVTEAVGKEMYDQIRPWIQAIAADGRAPEPLNTMDGVMRHLRVGSTMVALGGKLSTALFQVSGLTTTIKEIGLGYTALGFKRFMTDMELSTDPFAKAKELSQQIRDYNVQMDRELLGQFKGAVSVFADLGHRKNQAAHFSLAFMNMVQQSVNVITFYGALEKAASLGHENPVAFADSVVRMSQMGEGIKDKSALQRGSEMSRSFTIMYGYFNVLYNQMAERTPQGKSGLANAAAKWWWLVTLPVAIDMLFRKGPRGEDREDPAEWAKEFGVGQAAYIARSVPMFGLAADAVMSDHETRFAPWGTTILRSLKRSKEVFTEPDKEWSQTDIRDAVNSIGSVAHLPTAAGYNAFRYLDEFTSGNMQEPVQDLLFRTPAYWK